MKKFILYLCLCVLLLCNIASAYNITSDSGETYIRWDWSFVDTITSIYVDGYNVTEGVSGNFYYLQDLKPNEKHIISFYNNETLLDSNQATTSMSSFMIYFLTLLVLGITLLTLIVRVPYQQILFSIVGGILGVSLYMELSYHQELFSYVNLLLSIINGIIFCLVMLDLYEWSLSGRL